MAIAFTICAFLFALCVASPPPSDSTTHGMYTGLTTDLYENTEKSQKKYTTESYDQVTTTLSPPPPSSSDDTSSSGSLPSGYVPGWVLLVVTLSIVSFCALIVITYAACKSGRCDIFNDWAKEKWRKNTFKFGKGYKKTAVTDEQQLHKDDDDVL